MKIYPLEAKSGPTIRKLVLIPAFATIYVASLQQVAPEPILDWTIIKLSGGAASAGEPTIAADSQGGIHVFWSERSEDSNTTMLQYARKSDGIWSLNDIFVGHSRTPDAAVSDDGMVHLVWAQDNQLMYSQAPIQAGMSATTWAIPSTLADDSAYNPRLRIDRSGILHLAYSVLDDPPALVYMRSADSGESWSRAVFDSPIDNAAAFRPQIAIGENNTIHVVWGMVNTDTFYGGRGVYYARSSDSGLSWNDPIRIDGSRQLADSDEPWLASIYARGSSEISVVWDSHANAGERRQIWSQDNGLTWSAVEVALPGFVSQTGPNPMVADSAEMLFLFTAGTDNWSEKQGIYVSRWEESEWGDLELVDIRTEEPHFIRTTSTRGNQLHLVWQAREADPPSIWYATAPTDASELPPSLILETRIVKAGVNSKEGDGTPSDSTSKSIEMISDEVKLSVATRESRSSALQRLSLGVLSALAVVGIAVIASLSRRLFN